jgi:hypothetical protein
MAKIIETVRQPVVGNTLWQNTHILKQENGSYITNLTSLNEVLNFDSGMYL